jgi:hypothetical protein
MIEVKLDISDDDSKEQIIVKFVNALKELGIKCLIKEIEECP